MRLDCLDQHVVADARVTCETSHGARLTERPASPHRAPPPRRWAPPLLIAASLCLAASASAKPPPSKAKSQIQKAEKSAWQAVKLYERGSYEEAASLFLEAFRLSQHPSQLRNAAKAFQKAGMTDQALAAWRRYRENPSISEEERAEADAGIASVAASPHTPAPGDARTTPQRDDPGAASSTTELAPRAIAPLARAGTIPTLPVSASPAAPASVAEAPPAEGSSTLETTGYVLFPAAGALAIASTVLWVAAGNRLSALDASLARRDSMGRITEIGPTELGDEIDQINTRRVLSGVLAGVAVTAALTGTIFLIVSGGEDSAEIHEREEPFTSQFP